jgi:recombination protein RecA
MSVKKLKETNTDAVVQDTAASALSVAKDLVAFLNKGYKDGTHAQLLSEEADAYDFISTGSSILDLAISNRANGGLPVGRITEISGLEQSGKSLIGAHLVASTQKKGGVAVYIDTESAASPNFMTAVGVDTKQLIYVQRDTVEDIFSDIERTIEYVRSKELATGKKKILTIIVDSVAAASTKAEMEGTFDAQGWATAKARIVSQAMRKITNHIKNQHVCLVFINQLRVDPTVTFGDKLTTSGGKAIGFHSSVRVRLQQKAKIKAKIDNREELIGYTTQATVSKNRLGPPGKVVVYNIMFKSGIDDYSSWMDLLVSFNVISQAGAWYKYVDQDTGEEIKFQSKDFRSKLIENLDIRKQLYDHICKNMIMEYDLFSNVDFSFDENSSDHADTLAGLIDDTTLED